MRGPRVRDLSEERILSALLPSLPVSEAAEVPSGDDAAVLAVSDGRVAVSTDMLVEGTHFRQDWATGEDVAFRAVAQNVADAVAMGARPVSIVVAMQIPGELAYSWLEGFGRGLAAACREYEIGVDGGDLTSGPTLTVSVTVLGDLEGRAALRRCGARIGESLVLAGTAGRAAAGMELLERGYRREKAVVEPVETLFVDDFLRPKLPVGDVLAAARAGALGALMDVSDGLVRDARRMARASNAWLDIDSQALAPDLDALMVLAPRLGLSDPLEWAWNTVLSGGEDHAFLGTLACPPERARAGGSASPPRGFRRIGTVRERRDGGCVTVDGREVSGSGGWDHFRQEVR